MDTVTLSDQTIQGVAIVGKIVTAGSRQFKIHSVEGPTWYAFDQDGETVLDLGLTKVSGYEKIICTTVPSAQGFTQQFELHQVERRVCFEKAYV